MSTYIDCIWCGIEFLATKSTAKYCCDSHKTLANRERRRLEAIEYDRQLQQDELDEIRMEMEDEKRKREEQAAFEKAEHNRLEERDRMLQKEKWKKNEELRRIQKKERRKIENENKSKQADRNLKLKFLGGLTIFGLLNHFLNSKANQSKNTKTDHTVVQTPDKGIKNDDSTMFDKATSSANEKSNSPLELPEDADELKKE